MIVIRPAAPKLSNTFQVGQSYSCRSLADSDCIWTFTVIKRTAKFITIQGHKYDAPKRVGVRMYDGVETADPLGRYSMSPTIRADRSIW